MEEENQIKEIKVVKPKGNGWIFALWVLLFWPVVIVYYFMRDWK